MRLPLGKFGRKTIATEESKVLTESDKLRKLYAIHVANALYRQIQELGDDRAKHFILLGTIISDVLSSTEGVFNNLTPAEIHTAIDELTNMKDETTKEDPKKKDSLNALTVKIEEEVKKTIKRLGLIVDPIKKSISFPLFPKTLRK